MKKSTSACFLSLTLLMTASGLVACQTSETKPESPSAKPTGFSDMSAKERAAVDKLSWINNSNPTEAAQAVLARAQSDANQKPALLAFAGRGLTYPGLTSAEYEAIKSKVTYRIAEGSGDVIYGNTHREMRKKLNAYATTYNQAIVAGL